MRRAWCLPIALALGCARAPRPQPAESAPAPSTVPGSEKGAAREATEETYCPMRPDAPPGQFVPASARAEARLSATVPLEAGTVQLHGDWSESGALVALLQPYANGFCPSFVWSTSMPLSGARLSEQWVAPDRKVALFLFRLDVPKFDTVPAETRWVVIASDGARGWLPLKTAAGEQLRTSAVSFRADGKKVFVEAGPKTQVRTVFVLRPSGEFERLR